MKLNLSIFTCSFKYIIIKKYFFFGYQTKTFRSLTSLAIWIYQELLIVKYTDDKLIRAFNKNELDIAESIIHLNKLNDAAEEPKIWFDTMNYTRYLKNSSGINCLLLTSFIMNIDSDDILKRIKLLLKFDADIYSCLNLALKISCYRGLIDIVKFLLQYNSNIDIFVKNGILTNLCLDENSAEYSFRIQTEISENLTYAKETDRIIIIELLIEFGTDIHLNNDMSLRFACRNNYINIVELLLKHGANANANRNESLWLAYTHGHVDIVKLLLKNNTDTDFDGTELIKQATYINYNKWIPIPSYETYCKIINIYDTCVMYTNI